MVLGTGSKNKSKISSNPNNENISKLQIEPNRLKKYGLATAVVKELYRIDGGFKVTIFCDRLQILIAI